MKKLVLYLLMLPAISYSQKENESWITPIANIEFAESKIIYSYSLEECNSFYNLKPVSYNASVLRLKGVIGTGCVDDYSEMLNQIHDYLAAWNIDIANQNDKYIYLRATSLLMIWNIHWLDLIPENSIEMVGYLENDKSPEIAKAAKLVAALYYDNNK